MTMHLSRNPTFAAFISPVPLMLWLIWTKVRHLPG